MELPLALVVLTVVVLIAWAAPELVAAIFLALCAVTVYVTTMAVLARRGRR